MCTLWTKKIWDKFYLFKNRDLKYAISTKVKKENDKVKKILIVDDKWHCEWINEYGIWVVFATLKPYPLIKYPDSDTIARDILNQKNIKNAISIIKNSGISVNIIISDNKTSYIIEKTPYEFAMTKVKDNWVITNSSIKLNKKNWPLSQESRESSEIRYKRGKKLINHIENIKDIIKFLSDKESYPLYSICKWKESISPTRCSFIYDLKNRKIFFCKTRPDNWTYKEYIL